MFPPPTPPMPQSQPNPPQLRRGPNFTYALPSGWTVGEEGPFALVLRSPDIKAGIIVYGQSGLLQPMSPEQFAYLSMTQSLGLSPDVRFGPSQPIAPMPGYGQAAVMQTQYTVLGPQGPIPVMGVVFSQMAFGYGHCTGTITIAASDVNHWPHYQTWLPQVALQAVNTGPNPYGSTAMGQQMQQIAQQDHQANTAYRDWSQATWQAVVADRQAAQDRQQAQHATNLTGQQWSADPYGGAAMRRSTTPAAIWVSQDGREVASDDPHFDPRTPTDPYWRRLR